MNTLPKRNLKISAIARSVYFGTFQRRVEPWLVECFGEKIAFNITERNHRFLEEALELVQAGNCTAEEAHKLVDYVFGREVGHLPQEVGGVMVTLAALCVAHGVQLHECAETELARIKQPEMVIKIREKQKRKPSMSPLPGAYPDREDFAPSSQAEPKLAPIGWYTDAYPDQLKTTFSENIAQQWQNLGWNSFRLYAEAKNVAKVPASDVRVITSIDEFPENVPSTMKHGPWHLTGGAHILFEIPMPCPIEILYRNGEIYQSWTSKHHDWAFVEKDGNQIIAWRYSNEGEIHMDRRH